MEPNRIGCPGKIGDHSATKDGAELGLRQRRSGRVPGVNNILEIGQRSFGA